MILTDDEIKSIDRNTHFHESYDWPMRFARAIEAEVAKQLMTRMDALERMTRIQEELGLYQDPKR